VVARKDEKQNGKRAYDATVHLGDAHVADSDDKPRREKIKPPEKTTVVSIAKARRFFRLLEITV
jgi:hypothetical protein